MTRRIEEHLARGFTIFEVAVALFLLGLIFGSIVIPLRSRLETRKIEETERLLDNAREALLGYAATRGHFPCPADGASAGQEPTGTDHGNGSCPTYSGFLPAAALGLQATDGQGYAADAWRTPANRIRYAVASQSVGPGSNTNAFTRVNGMRIAGIAALGESSLSLLHVCDSGVGISPGASCGAATTLVSTAPVVVWSSGPNAATGGASRHEAQNPNSKGGSSDRIFVSRPRSEVPENEFDDILKWIPMAVLIHRLAAAGQLP
jgi:type II secretory pathway pseudopilin PulG